MPRTDDFITHDGNRIPRIVPKPQPDRPGSREAVEKGCTCPVGYNDFGKGFAGRPQLVVLRLGCPLHRLEGGL